VYTNSTNTFLSYGWEIYCQKVKIVHRKPNMPLDSKGCSNRYGSPGAVVGGAGQDVSVVTRDGEMVIHIAITALLVLEQEERTVEGCELDEAEVEVPEEAPVWHGGSERGEACATATDDDMGRRVESPAVMVRSILNTSILQIEKVPC
jgi:hypothetical protein